jgi:hypothetical protein
MCSHLVFRECKHIKNIFEDVYFTKNSFHIIFTSSKQYFGCIQDDSDIDKMIDINNDKC